MAPVTDAQLERIRAQLQSLSSPSITVSGVEVEDADGADGPVVLVTVKLSSTNADTTWNADDFLSIRRQARTLAVEALSGQDVRLVYESTTGIDDGESDTVEDERTLAGDE